MTDFPNVKPTRRSYTPGRFAYTQFEAQNGAVSLLRYGDRRTNAELTLGFDNINDEWAQAIIDNYDSVMTDTDGQVTFSKDTGLAGLSEGSLRNEVANGGDNLVWRYAEPPTVQSVQRGVSTVSCRFVGVFRGD